MVARITADVSRSEEAEVLADGVVAITGGFPYPVTVARLGLALLAVQREDVAAAREQYAALESLPGTMLLYISTDRVLGLLSVTMRQADQAVAHFEDALAFTRRSGYRPELAWTCCDDAEALLNGSARPEPVEGPRGSTRPVLSSPKGSPRADGGAQAKAMSLLEESLTIAREVGMRPLAERVAGLQLRLQPQSEAIPAYPDGLTQREVEVLRLIAQGKSNSQISQELVVAEGTTRRHVANIYEKIGVANRAEATRYALREGLLSLDETPSSDPGP